MKKTKKAKPKTKKIVKIKVEPKLDRKRLTVHKKEIKKFLVEKTKKQVDEVNPQTPIHDSDYWLKRPEDDKHLDWDYSENWIDGYWLSWRHPHRDLILEVLKEFEPFDLLEVGCNVGPNLNRIRQKFGGIRLAGVDIDPRLVEIAKDRLRDIEFQVAGAIKLPYDTQSFSCTLMDAVLMYISPDEIKQVLEELDRVTKKAMIIVDRVDKDEKGVRNGNVWARNYPVLLEKMGYMVKTTKLTKEHWPNSVGWQKFGYLIVASKN
ncbi:MAG: class I SAM-dependent methyltransferase [Nanoarchaeota archaeon]